MFTERRRSITVCCIAVIINAVCSLAARYLNLPLWLDTAGTVYAAMILGFPYGFLVGLVNNVFWAVVTHGQNSLAFFIVSLTVAFIAAKVSPKPMKMSWRIFAKLFVLLFLLSTLLAFGTTAIVNSGIPSDYWGQELLYLFESYGINPFLALLLSIASIKMLDTIVTLIVVAAAIYLTPSKYLDATFVIRKLTI